MPYPVAAARGRVARAAASGFNPLTESPRLALIADTGLFQASDGTTAAESDGDPVGYWTDQSAGGYHVSQATTGKKPVLKLGANGINGRPAVLFDGLDDLLYRAVANWLAADSAGVIFAVYRLTSTLQTGTAGLLGTADESTSIYFFTVRGSVTNSINYIEVSRRNNDSASSIRGNTPVSAATTYLSVFRSDGSAYSMRLNGADQTLTNREGTNTGRWIGYQTERDNLVIGGMKINSEANQIKGMIAELWVFGPDFTKIAEMEAYLNGRYGAY